MKKIIIALFVLVPSLGFSQVPHTFKSGDPVSSSKINENFAFVGKRLYLKNNGTTVGIMLKKRYMQVLYLQLTKNSVKNFTMKVIGKIKKK